MHIFGVLDGVKAEFNKNVEIQKFLILNFIESLLSALDIEFVYFVEDEINGIFEYTKVSSILEPCHFLNFKSSDNTNNLKKSFLASLDRFLNTNFLIFNPILDVIFNFLHKEAEKVTVSVTFTDDTFMFRGDLFEMTNVQVIEFIPGSLVGNCSQIVREDEVGTFKTNIFHN